MGFKKIDFNNLERAYLIAEIGINHNGDIDFVKKMTDFVKVFGWDCVKLQKRNPDVSTPAHQKTVIYDTPWGKMNYLDYRKRMEFNEKNYGDITEYCAGKADFAVSVWDVDSVDFILKFDPSFIKVPSAHLTNHDLLRYICEKGYPLLLSTGMSTDKEIDSAVDIVRKYTGNFGLMHCNSSYPADVTELNLKCISAMQDRYKCVVGYSGHEFGIVSTAAAICFGARILEKHVTLCRTMWGSDQMASVEPQGMLKMINEVRALETASGDGIKRVYDSELPVRKKLRGV